MTLPLHRFVRDFTRIGRSTLSVASLLLLFGSGCETSDSETSPATPDPPTPSTPPPTPTPPPPPPSPPDAPTGLRIVGEGATETHMFLDLEWDAVPEADLYRLDIDWDERCRFFPDRRQDPNHRRGLKDIDFRGTETNLEVTGTQHRALLARQQSDYCFRIRAEREPGGHSPWSSTVTGRTPRADANRTPDEIGTRTVEHEGPKHEGPIAGLYYVFDWRPVAGAYGYLYQHITITTRAPDNLIGPIEKQRPFWLPYPQLAYEVPIGNWHGCAAYARICSLYDENAVRDIMAGKIPRDYEAPAGCSGWTETLKNVIEMPGETLPPFRCRNAGPLKDTGN